MKSTITLLTALLFLCVASAQNNFINYKALVKDNLGNIAANQSIDIRFTIFSDFAQVYQETQNTTTDINGIVIIDIGHGNNFSSIDWSTYTTLQTEIDLGSGFVDLGTTEFRTVPYAFNAANVKGLETLDEGNGLGWRLVGKDPGSYGNIGWYGVDLSHSTISTNELGATGNYSFAGGLDVKASGRTSFAFGEQAAANGDYAIALGALTEASEFSTAIGNFAKATGIGSIAIGDSQAVGQNSRSFGYGCLANTDRSTALGFFNLGIEASSVLGIEFDAILEIGNGENSTNRSNALTILRNGTITAPSFDLSEITDPKALVTKEYVEGLATFSTTNNVTSNSNGNLNNDDFVFGSIQLNHSQPIQQHDNRMFFDKSKSAFRAGKTINVLNHPFPDDGTAWNETNIGESSFAVGYNTAATNNWSSSFGNSTIASGTSALASGIKTKAEAYASTALGSKNVGGGSSNSWVLTDPLFEIGNANALDNNAVPSNAFTVLKNGNSQISGRLSVGTNVIGTLGSLAIKGDSQNDMIQFIDNNDNNKWHIGLKSSGDDISFSESLVADGRLYLQKGGNIGINTTSPQNELHVIGGTDASLSNGSGYFQIGLETGSNLVFDSNEIISRNNGVGSDLYLNAEGGFTRIGGSSAGAPTNELSVIGNSNITGNLGVGTTSPTNKLVVQGSSANLELSNTEETEAGIIFNDSGDTVNQQASIMYDSNGFDNNLYIRNGGAQAILIDDDNDVTIGALFNNATFGKLTITGDSYQLALAKSDEQFENWAFSINGSNNLELRNDFSLKGTFSSATGAYTQASDRRLKTNIKALEPILDRVMRLEPSRYVYKNNPNTIESIGFIAQDVKQLFPEFVSVSSDAEGLHTLDYAGMSVLAIKAIQEFKNEIDTLKAENKALKEKLTKLEQLEARLSALENASNSKTTTLFAKQ